VSFAKKLYQLQKLKEAKEVLKAAEAAKETTGTTSDPDIMQDFLEDVKIPHESDRVLRRMEAKIRRLEGRISEVVAQVAQAPTAQAPKHVSDALDAADHTQNLTPRAKWRKRKAAQAREKELFGATRTERLNELGKLLTDHKSQVVALKTQVQKQAELREKKEKILAKKRELLQQIYEHEQTERRAKMVVRGSKERDKDDYDLDDILNDALRRAKKEPRPAPNRIRENGDVPASTIVMRPAGSGAVSVLKRDRNSDDDVLADPIMENLRANATVVDDTQASITDPTAGEPLTLASPEQRNPSITSRSTKKDPLQLPTSPSLSSNLSEKLRLNVPPTGFVPIDADLIVTFDSPVPQLQQQVFALRDRLKSSYPRIDTLPYDVWTSDNKRTLQTWLKILVSRWQSRFDHADSTGQLDKGVLDERLKSVLDQMVRDHDLSNDSAERMAMRWHEVFDKRNAMDSDAEGKLDWKEMAAGGRGFWADETDSEPLQQQHGKLDAATRKSSGSTMSGLTDRRMYSTSSRRAFSSWSKSDSKPRSIDNADTKDEPQRSQSHMISKAQPPKPLPHLPHLTSSGSAHMVSVSDKQHTTRTAIAVGTVYFTNPTPLQLIRSNSLKKGDVLGTSRIAGIMAAKKCPEIIPLCHPIALTHVGVELRAFGDNFADPSPEFSSSAPASQYSVDPGYGGIQIEAKVQCTGPTGVEMEALTAVMGTALSVVDMCKAVDKFQRVQDVRVVLKEGGKSGLWREEEWKSWQD
jgi:molybdenum cofactor biosynthesis enzyme